VLDLPGGHAKIPLGPSYVQGRDGHAWTFTDPHGAEHRYDEVLPAGEDRDQDP
jgi:lysine 2,3-aminomutase